MESSSMARLCAVVGILLLAACTQSPAPLPQPIPASSPPFQADLDASAAKPWTHQRFARGEGWFRFAVIGDRTGLHRPGVFEAALERLGWLLPEFVIQVGDLIEGYSEDPATLERQWREVHGLIDPLPMPFFLTVGNHDVGNATMLDDWLRRHGRTYYHFLYGDVLFLVLDTEDPPQLLTRQAIDALAQQGAEAQGEDPPAAISDRQVAWVRQVLARHAQARWTFVFMHKPAWLRPDANFEAVEALLAGRNYTVFAGHEHRYQYSRRRDRDYIRLGPVGGAFPSPSPGNVDHLTLVTMTPQGPQIANIELSGVFPKEGPR